MNISNLVKSYNITINKNIFEFLQNCKKGFTSDEQNFQAYITLKKLI